jgi:hypothetical protein
MKKFLLLTILSCGIVHLVLTRHVLGQSETEKPTAEELKAAKELSSRFVQRINETVDINPLVKELFVADFMKRYVREELVKLKEGKKGPSRILFTSGLEYDSELLEKATEEDWRALYVNTFNFMQYSLNVMFNAQAESMAAGNEADHEEMDKLLENMYPSKVMNLVNSNLILRNMVRKGNDARPMKTVQELRDFNKVLAEANSLLDSEKRRGRGILTPESEKILNLLTEKAADTLGPNLDVCEDECYGFPKGTRMIDLFATPMHSLLIVKVGADFKIIKAQITSPD